MIAEAHQPLTRRGTKSLSRRRNTFRVSKREEVEPLAREGGEKDRRECEKEDRERERERGSRKGERGGGFKGSGADLYYEVRLPTSTVCAKSPSIPPTSRFLTPLPLPPLHPRSHPRHSIYTIPRDQSREPWPEILGSREEISFVRPRVQPFRFPNEISPSPVSIIVTRTVCQPVKVFKSHLSLFLFFSFF